MRLLTHNYLKSNVRGTEKGYPLIIEPTKVECETTPVDKEFILTLLPKIQYDALLIATKQVGPHCDPPLEDLLPENLDDFLNNNKMMEKNQEETSTTTESSAGKDETNLDYDAIISVLHRVLLDIHVVEGYLICPDTGRRFPISEGIPNMILHEDEI